MIGKIIDLYTYDGQVDLVPFSSFFLERQNAETTKIMTSFLAVPSYLDRADATHPNDMYSETITLQYIR